MHRRLAICRAEKHTHTLTTDLHSYHAFTPDLSSDDHAYRCDIICTNVTDFFPSGKIDICIPELC